MIRRKVTLSRSPVRSDHPIYHTSLLSLLASTSSDNTAWGNMSAPRFLSTEFTINSLLRNQEILKSSAPRGEIGALAPVASLWTEQLAIAFHSIFFLSPLRYSLRRTLFDVWTSCHLDHRATYDSRAVGDSLNTDP